MAFYCALHLVDAYFAKLGKYYSNHEERNSEVANSLQDIFSAYYNLYDLGLKSHYGCARDNPSADEVKLSIDEDLPRIFEFMKGIVLPC